MGVYGGLDVHSKETVYVLQDGSGKVIGDGTFPTTVEGFEEVLKKHKVPRGTRIGLESGIPATWVSRTLLDLGMTPVVIDAREVRQKARRVGQKSDRRDAFDICDGLRRDIYTSIVYVPGPEIWRLRRILSRRRHFVRACTRQVNAAKFVVRSEGLKPGRMESLTTARAWERFIGQREVEVVRDYLEMHNDVWERAKEKVRSLDEALTEALEPVREAVELLETVPGVGRITAATYVAVLGTPTRFPESGHVVSYLGLAPATYDSGERERHGQITKRGSGEARAMLCEAAQQARKREHPLHPYFARVTGRHGYKKAVVAVAQRLARILYRMWLNGEAFDVTKLNVVRDGRPRSRVRHWRIRTGKEHSCGNSAAGTVQDLAEIGWPA